MNRQRWQFVLVGLALVVVTFWLYAPTRNYRLVNWDDDIYLHEVRPHVPVTAQTIRWAFTTFVPFYYHPLTWLSHAADAQFFGDRLGGPHLVNVALHAANAVAVFALGWLVFGEVRAISRRQRWVMAAGVAAVFAAHPLQVESVAWLAERKTVLCGCFSLLSLCAYLRGARPGGTAGWHGTALALYAAALLSKPMAVPLPVVMLVLDGWPLRRHESAGWRRLFAEKWSYWLLSVVTGVVTVVAQAQWGAVRGLAGLGVSERLLVAARGAVFYLWRLAWPAWLSPYYPLGTVSIWQPEFLVPVSIVVAVTGLCFCCRRKLPALLAAWAAYLALLAPASGLVQVGAQAVAARFVYLAMVPMLLLLAGGLWWCGQNVRAPGRWALAALVAAALVFDASRSRADLPAWRDEESLWRQALRYFPESGIANFHLAMALVEQHRFAEALPHAEYAVTVVPENPLAQLTLGVARLKTGRSAAAEPALRETLRLAPGYAAAQYNLACALSRQGRIAEARGVLRELLAREPSYRALAARDADLAGARAGGDWGF